MTPNELQVTLNNRHANPEKLAELIVADQKLLGAAVDGLYNQELRVSSTCAKALRILSREKSRWLYPYFNSFSELLGSTRLSISIEIIYILANLAKVDSQDMIDKLLDIYFEPLEGESLPKAQAVIRGALRIAEAKPQLAEYLAEQLLRVAKGKFENEEARRRAQEAALEALYTMKSMHLQSNGKGYRIGRIFQ